MGVCKCSMFCCTLHYVHPSVAIILMGKRELVALLNLSSWCLVMVERLFLAVPQGCLRFVIVVLLFFSNVVKCLTPKFHKLCRRWHQFKALSKLYNSLPGLFVNMIWATT